MDFPSGKTQEGEALGDESVLDVATGRVDELPQIEKRLHELEKANDVSSAEYMELHAKHDKLNDPQVEVKAKLYDLVKEFMTK